MRSARADVRREKMNEFQMRKPVVQAVFILVLALAGARSFAQAQSPVTVDVQTPGAQAGSGPPLTITLQDALKRARKNDPQFRSAVTDVGLAHEDRVQARAALLPDTNFNTSYIYTQGQNNPALAIATCSLTATCGSVPRYIANNAVHEYISQADVHQAISVAGFANYNRSSAMLALAKARSEIASRGLVVAVTQAYYGLVVAQRKYANVQRASEESAHFVSITEKLEKGGEVAFADVVKARIQDQQQQRDLQEAQLDMERARLDLSVLLFSNFNQDFTVVDDLQTPQPLPTFQEVAIAGKKNNPDLRAALATLQAANHDVTAAWGGLLPSLNVDFFYGIDATHFAIRTDGVKNLGYSGVATLQIPIFSWGSDWSKVKQAKLRQEQSRVEMSATQRQLLSHLRQFYGEAETARSEMESLSSSAQMAAESLRLTNMRYQAGEATVLEVVDAQNTLTMARNAYDDGQARYQLAIANLQTLTGTF